MCVDNGLDGGYIQGNWGGIMVVELPFAVLRQNNSNFGGAPITDLNF